MLNSLKFGWNAQKTCSLHVHVSTTMDNLFDWRLFMIPNILNNSQFPFRRVYFFYYPRPSLGDSVHAYLLRLNVNHKHCTMFGCDISEQNAEQRNENYIHSKNHSLDPKLIWKKVRCCWHSKGWLFSRRV